MSYQTEFLLPSLGDGDGGGRLINWLKQPGESFSKNDTLLEVETDKAVVEVPASEDGVLLEQLVEIDALIELGERVARVEYQGEAPQVLETSSVDDESEESSTESTSTQSGDTQTRDTSNDTASVRNDAERVFATPFARKVARENGIDLASLKGSGKNGRIVGSDVERADSSPGSRPSTGSMEFRERMIAVHNAEMFVKSWMPVNPRSGSTVVLIHGLFADSDAWTANASVLARNDIPVMAIDLPCHGRTTLDVETFDDVVLAVVEAVELLVDGPVTLIGHSFGAAVAARAARSPNLELNALGLIAPLGLGTHINQSFIDGMTGARTLDALRREMRKLTLSGQPVGEAFLVALKNQLMSRAQALTALCRSVAINGVQQVDIVSDLDEIGQLASIIHGRCDEIIPWQQVLVAPPRVALHLVPNAGHMPQWESSKLVTDLLVASTASR